MDAWKTARPTSAVPCARQSFEPHERIYARSASDDKSPIVATPRGARRAASRSASQPTSNLRIILDGEEEAGSPSLVPAIAQVSRQADRRRDDHLRRARCIRANVPPSSTARAATSTVQLTVFGPKFPLHSGHYGNWAPNPAMRLAELLATMKDDNGKVTGRRVLRRDSAVCRGRARHSRRRSRRSGRAAEAVRHRRTRVAGAEAAGRAAIPVAQRARAVERVRRRRGAHDHPRQSDRRHRHPPRQRDAGRHGCSSWSSRTSASRGGTSSPADPDEETRAKFSRIVKVTSIAATAPMRIARRRCCRSRGSSCPG